MPSHKPGGGGGGGTPPPSPTVSAQDLITRLEAAYPGLDAFLAANPNSLARLTLKAGQYAAQATGTGGRVYQSLINNWFLSSNVYQRFRGWTPDQGTVDDGTTTDPLAGTDPNAPDPYTQYLQTQQRADVRGALQTFLTENQLPTSLTGFIESALQQNLSMEEVVAQLRQTPEYKAAYPENDIRVANGLAWMPESQIRAYRDEAKRIAQSTLGVNVSNGDIAQYLLGKGKSLSEWESSLQTYATFERYGPAVKQVLSQELGYQVDDSRVFALMSAEHPTPELDRAYNHALMRGQPATLGFGVRPEQEAQLLEAYGISADKAFQGYQGIAAELPATQRYAAIESEINRNAQNLPPTDQLFANQSFGTLFRAIQLGDPQALQQLQDQMAREVARFRLGGGAAESGSGAAIGLLSAAERAQGSLSGNRQLVTYNRSN